MGGLVSFIVDLVMIVFLGLGVATGLRLMRELAALRSHQADMERIILSFNAGVNRAESGIKGLKQAARSAGDDLEPLIERAQNLRDELQFLIDSADQMATRLSDAASQSPRQDSLGARVAPSPKQPLKPTQPAPSVPTVQPDRVETESVSARARLARETPNPVPLRHDEGADAQAEPRAMQIVRQVLAAAEKGQTLDEAPAEMRVAESVPAARNASERAPVMRNEPEDLSPSSAAERELLRALQNLK